MAALRWLETTESWRAAYSGASMGAVTVRAVTNPARHVALKARKAELEHCLRQRYAGQDRAALLQLPVLQAYAAYYKRFKNRLRVLATGAPVPSQRRVEVSGLALNF